MCFFEDASSKPEYAPAPEYRKDTLTIEDLLRGNPIAACSVMFRNGLFGTFPDWFLSLPIEDWPLYILNAQHGKVGYINEAMAAYRVHSSSIYSSLSYIEKMLIDIDFYRVINAHLDFKYRHLIGEMVALRYQAISSQYLLKNDTANARHYVLKSIKSLPLRRHFAKSGIIIIIRSLMILAKSMVLKRAISKGNSQ